jgi:hypothetical protein
MKREMVIALAVALALVIGLGSIAYAAYYTHQPMTGQKMVGTYLMGRWDEGPVVHVESAPSVIFSNPDCKHDLAVTRTSIIRQDGAVMYEGPATDLGLLKPHQAAGGSLAFGLKNPETGAAISPDEALSNPAYTGLYTVEFIWTGKGLPPTATILERIRRVDESTGSPQISYSEITIPMTLVNQK